MRLAQTRHVLPGGPRPVLRDAAPLYALLDAARSPRVLEVVKRFDVPHSSLFQGRAGQQLAAAAPYLVSVPTPELLEALVTEGWGRAWGVYAESAWPFEELRRHLRRLLFVDDLASGKTVYFRFYDPRVLRPFLPVCHRDQLALLFAGVSRFFVEGGHGAETWCFAASGAAPERRTLRIDPAQSQVLQEASFEGRAAAFLRRSFRDAATLPGPALSLFVATNVARAREHGLERERHIADYLAVAWLRGDEVREDRRLGELLASSRPPEDKHEGLLRWAESRRAASR